MISGFLGIVLLLRSVRSDTNDSLVAGIDANDTVLAESRGHKKVWAGEIFTQMLNSSYDKRIRPPNRDENELGRIEVGFLLQ
ncbi:hypothetical protein Y032_1084g3577 [Ancylostoma ceylanicum]|uniref:Neurotransmitter-gated ion-channel ligand-binding domain-containing protein n=2 Tax=Ancylostoma ceylanicum TaxID=53326 RepID=A0A016W7K4_9BILA|nr:hypothetical protein Y032_1084g3577 [Ancylostoma ceylanicum]